MEFTDAELRQELGRLGITIGPVTETTRRVYMKRLDKLKKAKEANQELAKSQSLEKAKPGRTRLLAVDHTISESSARPTPKIGQDFRSNDDALEHGGHDDNENSVKRCAVPEELNMVKPKKISRRDSAMQDAGKGYSSSKQTDTCTSTPVFGPIRVLDGSSDLSSILPERGSTRSVKQYFDDSGDTSDHSSNSGSADTVAEYDTTATLEDDLSSSALEKLRKFRAEIEAWKREEFGDARFSPHQKPPSRHGSTVQSDSYRNRIFNTASRIFTRLKLATRRHRWTLNFSSFLPVGTCIFFIILGLLYATMKYDSSLNSVRELNNVTAESSQTEILLISNLVYDRVAGYEGEKECGTIVSEDWLQVSTLRKELSIPGVVLDEAFQQLLDHPEWGVEFYDDKEKSITGAERLQDAVYAHSPQSILSGWCRFKRAVQKVLLRIAFTTVAGILAWLGLVYRQYRSSKQREEKEEMYIIVEKIIDVLWNQYEESERNPIALPFLPILHVRDAIIAPQDRQNMSLVWEKAEQFISANETRIRVEHQTIRGEDYLVWRWIQASTPTKRLAPTSRVWQGDAFDITKKPMICPTPCLKLRNVFDPSKEVGKNWAEQIQDSILEKCQGNDEILRICVEKDSREGIVYILCASDQAAGRAFQALHGTWFDRRLITVKFIRLSRFHQRFPDVTRQSLAPMTPSSTNPVSTILASPPCGGTSQYKKMYPTLSEI